ncbi:MAG: glycosyltransferase [Candidatus Omnitrophica bacterium]|nr:glycosyltransferase [Candidatus Omnitrophota bacterium]
MNILYICPRFPYPADQGDKVVVYEHLKFLSTENKITLLSFVEGKERSKAASLLSGYCSQIEVFKRRRNFSIINFIRAIFDASPFSVIRYYSPQMFKRAKALIESGEFDTVHVAFYYMGQYAVNKKISVPKKTAVILDTHNIEYLLYSRYARLWKNPFMKLLFYLEALRIKRCELAIYKKFDRCIAFSELDRANITRLSGASNIEVVPACVELPPARMPDVPEERNTIFFFGLLNTPANNDAVKFFYKNIFPLIRKKVPEAKFIIAGKKASRYITAIGNEPGVRLLGFVADIRAILKMASVVVVPLRLGGGTRIKILEAWSMKKAVISTSIGAEGVDVKNRTDIVIADSPSEFAESAAALLKDEAERKRLGEAAFKKTAENHDPGRVIKALEAIYKNAKSVAR